MNNFATGYRLCILRKRHAVSLQPKSAAMAIMVSMAKTGQSGFYDFICVDLLRHGMTEMHVTQRLRTNDSKHLITWCLM